MIQNGNMCIRQFRKSDVEDSWRWKNGRKSIGECEMLHPCSLSSLTERFNKTGFIEDDKGSFIIEVDGNKIGFCTYFDLNFTHQRVTVGIVIAEPDFRGRGSGCRVMKLFLPFLFTSFPINRVVAETSVENVPSQKLFLKLGFRKEGVLRKHYFVNGKLHDNIVFGLLREEWEGRTLK